MIFSTPFRTLLIGAILAVVTVSTAGCGLVRPTWFRGAKGSMRTESLGDDPVVLRGNFAHVFFSHDVNAGASFFLSDVPVGDLLGGKALNGQVLHVQLLWNPKAGSTPMDSSATNASIRYVVVANGEVGLYSGAGFALPADSLDSSKVTISLADATLQLQEATAGFSDLLSPAQLSGTFTARRDDQQARQMHRAASQLVTNAFGKTMFVKANERSPAHEAANAVRR